MTTTLFENKIKTNEFEIDVFYIQSWILTTLPLDFSICYTSKMPSYEHKNWAWILCTLTVQLPEKDRKQYIWWV